MKMKMKMKSLLIFPISGAPEIKLMPPAEITVSEDSTFEIKVQMAGNPKPTAIFQWSIETNDKSIEGTELYPYFFQSIYTLNSIPTRYCRRTLFTKVRNSLGTVSTSNTRVTVLRKYNLSIFVNDLSSHVFFYKKLRIWATT